MAHEDLESYFKTNFALMQHHNWSLSDIESMIPWEREIYVGYLIKFLEKQKLEAQQAQQNANSF